MEAVAARHGLRVRKWLANGAALEAAEKKDHDAFLKEARALSAARAKAAPQLAKAVTQAMQGLGMQGGRFEVALDKSETPAAHGLGEVAFLGAGHAGSTPGPGGKGACGGELSRIALAIAVTTSRLGEAQTLIFDEVDSGVGGAGAETVFYGFLLLLGGLPLYVWRAQRVRRA